MLLKQIAKNISRAGFTKCAIFSRSKYSCCVDKVMQQNQIVPLVIRRGPTKYACVTFPSGVSADMGNELTPSMVRSAPYVEWGAIRDTYYTIAMVDPDAPTRGNPIAAEWKHWLVVNIPYKFVTQGEYFTPYIGAAPPKGTGLHRYIILVYKQPGKIKCNELRMSTTNPRGRDRFCVREFAFQYKMGNPIAGNFFIAKYDDYVPRIYAQLGIKM